MIVEKKRIRKADFCKEVVKKYFNPFNERTYLINRFLGRDVDHLYYHSGLDFILKSSNILQHYSKKIHTINFNHISSITNLRQIEDMNLIKFSVEECLSSLDQLIDEYDLDNEEFFELKNLYNKLL